MLRSTFLLAALPAALSWVLPTAHSWVLAPQIRLSTPIGRSTLLKAAGNEIDAPEYKENPELEGLSLEEEIELGVEQELKKTKVSEGEREAFWLK